MEERDHAEMLWTDSVLFLTLFCFWFCGVQNIRGGRVKLEPMVMPQFEFDHAEKGDDLYGKVMFHEILEVSGY